MKKQLLLLFVALLMVVGAKAQSITIEGELETFSYVYGNEFSESQQLTIIVQGVDTLNVGVDDNFEISKDNVNYGHSTQFIIEDTIPNSYPIYVRMILGLNAGEYSGEISFADQAGNAEAVSVNCIGHVDKAQVATPSFDSLSGTYHGPLQVTISCDTVGAIIRYTTDGSNPNENSTLYETPFDLNQTATVKARAWKEDGNHEPSDVASVDYTIQYRIHVTTEGEGLVNDSLSVDEYVNYGETFTLTAYPSNGNAFGKWTENGVDITDNPYVIDNVGTDHEIVAHFVQIEYSITVASNNEDWGYVSSVNNPYHYGDTVELEAFATDSTDFIQWNNGDTVNPRQIIVTGDSTYTAVFDLKRYTIELIADPIDGGIMTLYGTPSFGQYCTIIASANEDEGFTFVNWTEDNEVISDSEQYTFYVNRNHTFIAHFTQLPRVGEIEIPASVCDGVPLDINVPEIVNADGGQWQLSPDENFDPNSITLYFIGQTIDQSYNGWWLRYMASNDYGSDYSNSVVISIHSFIDASTLNEIVKKDNYILVYPNPVESYKYQWYKDGNRIEGANDQYYYQAGGLDNGNYKVYVSFNEDTEGNLICGAFSKEIVVNDQSPVSLSVYPNPSHIGEIISVVNNDNENAMLTIYALDGRLLHSQTIVGNQASLSLSLSKGIYVIRLTNSRGSKIEKIVIQ